MKLNARDAEAWIAKPPPDRPGTLIYGNDAMRVALKRADLVARLIGPSGDDEMRLTRLPAAELRRDPAAIADALKAQGFFPGPRAVLVEDATNQHAESILAALGLWGPGDAHMVVTASALKPASALRKGFEKHPAAAAIAVYDNPPSRAEVEGVLKASGLTDVPSDAMAELTALAQTLTPGDFRQTLEKIALYKHGDPTPINSADIAASAPASVEADLDDAIAIVADCRAPEIGPVMRRLEAQGMQPVTLCIGITRHFRTLHAAASDPGGPGSGIGKLRPPVFGPRRDAILRQASTWGTPRLEQALHVLTDTDLALRSSARVPQMALMERTMIRIAMMGSR